VRIGIDARELCGRPTGVGRYLGGLLNEWAVSPDAGAHEFVLYAPEALAHWASSRFTSRVVAGHGTIWEQWALPRAAVPDRLDVFFAPGYSAPLLLKAPVVVAIHDVSYAAHPEWFTWREGSRRRTLSRATARRARTIVTISEFSRGEIVRLFGIDRGRIHVIPPGIGQPERSTEVEPRAPSPEPRVLFVGSIFNRRNIPTLIDAIGLLAARRPRVELDLVGDNRSYPSIDVEGLVARAGGGRVRWHRYVTDTELDSLYARASAFAFLSDYEGLGLTPLEALARGVPPVLLDTAVARESCGDAAIYVSRDPAAVAAGLDAALSNDERTRVLDAAPRVLARYDWPTAARATLLRITERA
jgi:glycosyltransferase involved in cell wall biosynthesis